MPTTRKAFIIVDVQNDFCPDGSLAVASGDEVVAPLNRFIAYARVRGWLIVASRDWHPEITKHFDTHGGPWPAHCVQETPGAQFHSDLDLNDEVIVITKGTDPSDDGGYSAFDGTAPDGHSLGEVLRGAGITEVYVGGLATDWCVKATALGAVTRGMNTYLLLDAIRAVDLEPDDGGRAIEKMQNAGVVLTSVEELLSP